MELIEKQTRNYVHFLWMEIQWQKGDRREWLIVDSEKLSQLDVKLDYPRQAFYHLSSCCCSNNINRRDINKVIFDISSHPPMIRRCETRVLLILS